MRKLIILISIIALATGCTISYSFTGASIPPDAKTVFVADFRNVAPLVNPSLANDLTEAMKDKFVGQTSLKLGDENADLYFEGSITAYGTQPVAIKTGDVAAQNRLTITVKVKFVNNKDKSANFDTSFSRYEDYDSQYSLTDVEDQLVKTIVESLVDDIFTKAVVNW
ncbi:MAG: LptE family protein [Salinivirgaceae bacterium]|nr:LptE family protein [Salinivirgaceae bacterium]MBR3567114.1 LptE family protein [Salinivirgaceae bacterium]MBR4621585.1 LptE family protein [Salinivirgaceae bacterium]